MLKIWNINKLAREMPSSLLTEWIIFSVMENEETENRIREKQLVQEATQGINQMKAKRGRR